MDCSVVIVGGGLSGLKAARELVNNGFDPILLEARQRVGGRVSSGSLEPGLKVDFGAQWITPGQWRIRRLADQLGVERTPVFETGKALFTADGKELTITVADHRALRLAIGRLDRMLETVPLAAPWQAPRAAQWDAVTFGHWLRKQVPNPQAQLLLQRISDGHHCASVDRISLLHALFYARSNGGFATMAGFGEDAGGLEFFPSGAQEPALRMAQELGDRVRLGHRVTAVRQHAEGVTVNGSGFEIRAHRALVALPPAVTSTIDFTPELPAPRRRLTQLSGLGGGHKVHAVYGRPFWRRQGLSGQAVSELGQTSDGSPSSDGPGLLISLVAPEPARRLAELPAAERRQQILQRLADLFGPKALRPEIYHETYWVDQALSAGDVTYFIPGAWTEAGTALRAPVGRVHWGGTETATEFYSHMEGALQAADRAAEEISQHL